MRARYSEAVWGHFRQPHGGGGLPAGFAGRRLRGNADTPGSEAELSLEIGLDGDHIEAAGFHAYGCPTCIAAASWVCVQVEGRTVSEAGCLTVTDVEQALDMPAAKRHCALLALDALTAALERA